MFRTDLCVCVRRDLEEALEMGMDWSLREGYAWAEDKEHCEEYGRMLQADPNKVSSKAKKRGLPQVRRFLSAQHRSLRWRKNPALRLLVKSVTRLLCCSLGRWEQGITTPRSRWWTRSTMTTQPKRWASTTRVRCA